MAKNGMLYAQNDLRLKSSASLASRSWRQRIQAALLDSLVALLFLIPSVLVAVQGSVWPGLTLAVAMGLVICSASLVGYVNPTRQQQALLTLLFTIQLGLTQGLILLLGVVPSGFFFLLNIRRIFIAFGLYVGYVVSGLLSLLFIGQLLVVHHTSQFTLLNSLLWLVGLLALVGRTQAQRREQADQIQREALIRELAESERQVRAFALQAEELAAARERNRIARDLHDSLGHYLMAINIQLEKALAQIDHRPAEVRQTIVETRQLASEVLQDVRQSVATLRATDEVFSARKAITKLADEVRAGGLPVTLSVEGDETHASTQTLMGLCRVGQEALTNIRKHAQANLVTMTLTIGEENTGLTVADNGVGFDATQPRLASGQAGHGLQGMQERLALLGGQLTVESMPSVGTRLVAVAPSWPFGVQR